LNAVRHHAPRLADYPRAFGAALAKHAHAARWSRVGTSPAHSLHAWTLERREAKSRLRAAKAGSAVSRAISVAPSITRHARPVALTESLDAISESAVAKTPDANFVAVDFRPSIDVSSIGLKSHNARPRGGELIVF